MFAQTGGVVFRRGLRVAADVFALFGFWVAAAMTVFYFVLRRRYP